MPKQRVLILCTGNSARSQMAEGILREIAGERFDVFSAGTRPVGLNPNAVTAMAEVGINISGQRSKSVDEFAGQTFDYVITVCDNARESCPIFPGAAERIHRRFEDPAASPNDLQPAAFRRVRDQLADWLREFAKSVHRPIDFEQYRGAVTRYIRYLIRDSADAEDLAQETFIRAHRQRDTLRDPGALESWLYQIATHASIDRMRQRAKAAERHVDEPVEELEQLSYLPPTVLFALDRRLRSFSRSYDDLVRTFAQEKIQIQTAEKPKGLFKNSLSAARVELLAHDIHPETTFESFLDLCFDLFWELVEVCLKNTREYIEKDLKSSFDTLFANLLADVEKITSGSAPELNDAIRAAQTRARQAIQDIKDWFRPAKPLPPRSFSLHDLVQIGLEQVRKRYREFDPCMELEISEMPEFAQLTRFSDIFVIIFDNIRRHSGVPGCPTVKVHAQFIGKYLEILVESVVAANVRSQETDERIARIKKVIADGSYHRATRSEGGTGLIKLRNIMGTERDAQNVLDFGFSGSELFFVKIQMPMKEIVIDPEGSGA